MPLSVERHDDAEGPVVTVTGDLDITTADRLERALLDVEASSPELLHLDLRGVEFFDSTGLQMVLDAQVRAKDAGRRLLVVAGDGEARRVIELAEVAPDLELR